MRVNVNRLMHELHELGEQHCCHVKPDDYKLGSKMIDDLKTYNLLTHTNCSIYDMNHHSFAYCSPINEPNCEYPLFAYQAGIISKSYSELIHPDDLPALLQSNINTYESINELPADEKKHKVFCCLFRIRNEAGNYQLMFYQITVLRTDSQGQMWLLLISFSVLSHHLGTHPPCGCFMGELDCNTGKCMLLSHQLSGCSLSDARLKVLTLIMDGYERDEIAKELEISVYTVDNHRRAIVRKMGVKDMIQALTFAIKMGAS